MNAFNNTNTSAHFANELSPEMEKRARRRAGAKVGWLIHLTVFVIVNAGLWMAGAHRGWLGLPTGGWIIGLVVHGMAVWLSPVRDNLQNSMVERERQALRRGME